MNDIARIIFNELASHRAIALPRVGTLRVVRHGARGEGNDLTAPENRVVYSMETDNDIPTVTSLGIDDSAYDEWLSGAMLHDELMIDGVGTLVLGEFIPSDELEQALNPHKPCSPQPTAHHTTTHHTTTHKPAAHHHHTTTHHAVATPPPVVPPKRNCLTNWLLAIIIVLLLALLGIYLCQYFDFWRNKNEVALTTKVEVAKPEVREVEPILATPAEVEVEHTLRYHLIVGSFDDATHADQVAKRYARRYPNLTVETVDNGSGRTLVSVFQSDTNGKAYARFYKIAEQTGNWDMWVFEEK